MAGKNLSILIPTLNRPDFVVRALNYYADVGFEGYICLGDSSGPEHVAKIKDEIAALEGRLKVIYRDCPRPSALKRDPMGTPSEAECVKHLADIAPTEYAALSPDDDFLVPAGLDTCVEFLEANPDYSGAHGVRIDFELKEPGPTGDVERVYFVNQPTLVADSPVTRWREYMRRAVSPLYSVMSIATWRAIFEDGETVPMRYLGSELLQGGRLVISGKVAELECLTTVHQDNDDRVWGWETQSMYSLLVHPHWTRAVGGLRSRLAEAIVVSAGMETKEAQRAVDEELWRHIHSSLGWQMKSLRSTGRGDADTQKPRVRMRAINWALSLTLVRKSLRRLLGRLAPFSLHRPVELESMLSPGHPFHDDFSPIYRAIAGGVAAAGADQVPPGPVT